MSTPSHRLKLKRAYKHLSDLTDMIREFGVRKPYPVVERVETNRKGRQWTYTLSLDVIEPDEMFPIILGDFLFNLRSALDHLMVAIAPANRKSKTSFPLFLQDPLAMDEDTTEYLRPKERDTWLTRTKGLPSDVLAHLAELQPYNRARQHSKPAKDYSLAVLGALQNADKHRNLVTVVTGLSKPYLSLDAGTTWTMGHPDAVLKNGARLHTAKRPVQVQIEGSAVVGVGTPNEVRDLLWLIDALYRDMFGQVLPRLEPFVKKDGHPAPSKDQ